MFRELPFVANPLCFKCLFNFFIFCPQVDAFCQWLGFSAELLLFPNSCDLIRRCLSQFQQFLLHGSLTLRARTLSFPPSPFFFFPQRTFLKNTQRAGSEES